MATIRKQVPFEAYTALHTGPCIIDMMTRGRIRIAAGAENPGAASLPFHLIHYPAGQFVYKGSETVWAMGDKLDEAPFVVVTSNEAQHLIAQGKAYRVSGKIANLSAYGWSQLLVKVPSGAFPRIQRTRVNAGGGDVDIVTYEGPTITADGTLTPAINLNRNSAATADMGVYVASTLSAIGSSIDSQWVPPTAAGIGQRLDDAGGVSANEDWILKENTNYVIRFTNNSPNEISLWFELLWYEL